MVRNITRSSVNKLSKKKNAINFLLVFFEIFSFPDRKARTPLKEDRDLWAINNCVNCELKSIPMNLS